jgi:triacylglycerol esterase/lipase EstA (alpha/beta hydrolase family)
MDFDGGGVLYNWSPGMAGNYLQQLGLLLNAGRKPLIVSPISNNAALSRLAADTLYVPDFNMINYSAFSGKSKIEDEVDVKNVFEKYTYPYKVISKDALDKKIIETNDPFYYLLFLKIGSAKVVCVINGKTGETIYSRSIPFSSNLKPGDINGLFKQIGRE